MHYRLYRPEDFSQLYAIEELCFQPPIRFPRRYMRQLVDSPASATWVAEEDQKMAGFAIVDWTQESDQTIAYIQTVEVAPAHRNRGIATELLRRVESSAIAAGARVLWLHVAEQNATAIRLYHAHGYLLQGREENFYAPGLPALIFSKPLD
jgi:[ribosomal protein S18]-alanine N-acetyltransferase